MDDATLEALDGFNKLWGRVTGAAGSTPELMDLADAAAHLGGRLAALSCRCPRSGGKLAAMAREEESAARRLCAEHYLITGERRRPSAACAVVKNALDGLREAYSASGELAEALSSAANAAPCELRGTLDRLAAAERRHAFELRCLIFRALGANWT